MNEFLISSKLVAMRSGLFSSLLFRVCSFSGVDDFDHHGQSVFDQVRKLNGGQYVSLWRK